MKKTLVALLAIPLFCLAASGQVTAIKAGHLVDPDTGTVLTDQVILIRGNKIEQVGKALTIPADARVIDLSSKTVLPGLIKNTTPTWPTARATASRLMF